MQLQNNNTICPYFYLLPYRMRYFLLNFLLSRKSAFWNIFSIENKEKKKPVSPRCYNRKRKKTYT